MAQITEPLIKILPVEAYEVLLFLMDVTFFFRLVLFSFSINLLIVPLHMVRKSFSRY
jgi:hypothetical protein